ncbi:uncharacterized protein [Parasteatoda tepidariorum]|uniref:uncharacterized protein n=1 Tax=Parasteatoda tepidariorum TaxID=114398 RepID=UPI00077FCFBA|nr:uncharacterized protein LOC107454633 [Parasteatoda tepidariorum]
MDLKLRFYYYFQDKSKRNLRNNMWIFITFLFTTVYGAHIPLEENGNSVCSKAPSEACMFQNTIKKFTETSVSVDDLCNELVNLHHCMSNFFESCDTDKNQVPFRSVFDSGMILMVCKNNSAIHKTFTDNAKCISNTVKKMGENGFCRNHLTALAEETPDIQDKVMSFVTDEHMGKCLEMVFEIGCIATELSESCTPEAKHLFIWFVDLSRVSKSVCSEEYEAKIDEFVELMKFDLKH